MPYFFLALVDKHDREAYARYSAANREILASLDVKPLALTDDFTTHEGDPNASSIVLLEFPDESEFRKWWDSPEYAEAKKIRMSAADLRFAVTFGQSTR
ncbi:DUF1330 domain-containing protein [Rhodococcus sp. WS4]|nr:DUF1330 domain-containing protein [Rhodococcus sp. WS4]